MCTGCSGKLINSGSGSSKKSSHKVTYAPRTMSNRPSGAAFGSPKVTAKFSGRKK